MKNQQYYMPAVLICGIIAGLLSGIPCVNVLMCCFCIQIVLPGMFAVKFVADKANQSIDAGESAIIGVIVGGIGAAIGAPMIAIWQYVSGSSSQAQLAQLSPEFAQAMAQGGGNTASSVVGTLCCVGVMFPLFGALGGLIGSAVFKKDPPGGQPPYGGGGGYDQPAQGGFGQPQSGGGFGQPPSGGGFGQPPSGGGFGQPPSGGGFGT